MKWNEIIKEISKSRSEMASALPVLSLNQRGVRHRAHAGIASYLVPKADKDVKKGTKIFVTGNDGPNLDGKRYAPQGDEHNPWLKALREWLNRGADVTYFLLNPSLGAVKHLKELAAENHSGKLEVYSVKRSAKIPVATRELLKEWKTTHFAVFENPPQFWLEGHHEEKVTEAQNCYFLPKPVAKKSPLPNEYKHRLEIVIKRYGKSLLRGVDKKGHLTMA